MSAVYVDSIKDKSDTKTLATLSSSSVSLHSDVVFPSGHVVQMQKYETSSEQTNITANSFNTAKTIGSFAFTPKFASSNIFLFASVICISDVSGGNIYLDFYKNADDFTETANLSGNSQGVSLNHNEGSWQSKFMMWLDECSENSTSEKTYKISARLNATGSGYIGWGSNSPAIVIIQEIAT